MLFISKKIQLSQNYSNPFNPTITTSHQNSKSDYVKIKIYDTIGREVRTLVHKKKNVGYY